MDAAERSIAMLCDDEPLSDVQKLHQRAQVKEYQTFLRALTRLSEATNVCISQAYLEAGSNGLLTGPALNVLGHSGALAVYKELEANDWHCLVKRGCSQKPDGEVLIIDRSSSAARDDVSKDGRVAVQLTHCVARGQTTQSIGPIVYRDQVLPANLRFQSIVSVEVSPDSNSTTAPSEMDKFVEFLTKKDSQGYYRVVRRKLYDSDGSFNSGSVIYRNSLLTKNRVRCEPVNNEVHIPLEEYYYMRENGAGRSLEHLNKDEETDLRFKCHLCAKVFFMNARLMDHAAEHLKMEIPWQLDDPVFTCTKCPHLFFESPFHMIVHRERAHPEEVKCRICDVDFPNVDLLCEHLHLRHRQLEMPYVCRLCSFRTSMMEDLLAHFRRLHSTSHDLLCWTCLQVFNVGKSSQIEAFFEHLGQHQKDSSALHNPCCSCRLSFVSPSELERHRRDHNSGVLFSIEDRRNETLWTCLECRKESLRSLSHIEQKSCSACKKFKTHCPSAVERHEAHCQLVVSRKRGPKVRLGGPLRMAMRCQNCSQEFNYGDQLAEHLFYCGDDDDNEFLPCATIL